MILNKDQYIRAMALEQAVAAAPQFSKVVSGFEVALDKDDILDLADEFVYYIEEGRKYED